MDRDQGTQARIAAVARAIEVDPVLLRKLLHVALELLRNGVKPVINLRQGDGGKRDSSTQAQLYAQGRTTPGRIVTYAKPGQSKHETGRAGHIEVPAANRALLGALAEGQGLVWGGRWTTKFPPLGDWQHVELP